GYGNGYLTAEMMRTHGVALSGAKVIVSGSGNVAIYAAAKAQEHGATVVAMSGSSGYILTPEGVDVDLLKDIKENRRERINSYAHNASEDNVESRQNTELAANITQ